MGPNSGGLPAPEPVEAPDPLVRFHDASYMPIMFLPPHVEQIWNIVIVAVVVSHTLLCVPVIANVEQ